MRCVLRRTPLVALLLLGLITPPQSLADPPRVVAEGVQGLHADEAEVFLGTERTRPPEIQIGLLPWLSSPETASLVETGVEVLKADLRRSLVFSPVDLAGEATDSWPAPHPSLLQKAKAQGASLVLVVRLDRRGPDLVFEARAYDAASAQAFVRKRYLGAPQAFRAMIHRLVDALVLRYTGEPGIARTRIAFISTRSGSPEVHLMDYDGANPMRVTVERTHTLSPRWTPDGRWLTYVSYRNGDPAIHILDLRTSRRWMFVDAPGLDITPAWSPAGHLLAFSSTRSGPSELYLVDRQGKRPRRLTFSRAEDLSPSWSPNGRQLVFTSDRGGSPQLYIMDADGSNVHRLTFTGRYNTTPAWSPKGDWIAYTCRRGAALKLCLITPGGRETIQLTADPGDDEAPAWAPDGRHLVFTRKVGGTSHIFLIVRDGSGLEQLTTEGRNTSPAWSPY